MFEAVPSRLRRDHDLRVVIGVLSVLYALSLLAVLLAGPFILSYTFGVPLGVASESAILVVAVGYVLGAVLLLR